MISATSNRCRDVNSYAALACSISVEIVDVWDICDVDEESSSIMHCFGSVFISWMWMMMLRKIIPKISGNDCAIGK